MNSTLPIDLPFENIAEFCRRQPIRKLSLFGSILREDFTPESDIDMLVEFIPDSKIGYFELIGMELELTEMLKRKVDLRTPAELSRYFRQQVLDAAQVIYVH
jgi:hypothetical protein